MKISEHSSCTCRFRPHLKIKMEKKNQREENKNSLKIKMDKKIKRTNTVPGWDI